jgi:Mechanosensitive ion channel
VSGAVVNASEVTVLVAAVVILLSMLGLNLSGLLIPAGVALALAAKDLSHNFLAGFFLFAVQVPPGALSCLLCRCPLVSRRGLGIVFGVRTCSGG